MRKIICILMSLTMLLLLCSCGATPDKTVTSFCEAVKTLDSEEMNKCCSEDIANFTFDDSDDYLDVLFSFCKQSAKKIEYKVTDSNTAGDTGTVNVEFTYIDATDAFAKSFSDYMTQAFANAFSGSSDTDMDALFQEILEQNLSSDISKTNTTVIEFMCIKDGGNWVINSISEDIYDVIMCGIYSQISDLENAF